MIGFPDKAFALLVFFDGFWLRFNRAILVTVKRIEVAVMDIFFGYNPYVMITIYALLVDGVFHALRARKVTPKRVTKQNFDF